MFLRVHSPAVPVPPQRSWTQRCALSAHSPCCRDEASSISSPATLCEEEPHRLILQPGGTCTRPLLSCSPESHARGWDLFPRGTKGPHLSHRGPGQGRVYRQQQRVLKAQQGPASTPAPNTAGLLQQAGERSALTWLQPSGLPCSRKRVRGTGSSDILPLAAPRVHRGSRDCWLRATQTKKPIFTLSLRK